MELTFFFWNKKKINSYLEAFVWAMPTPSRRNLKTEVSLWKHISYIPSTRRRRNLKTQQSPVILENSISKITCTIMVTASLSKLNVFKMFSVHTKMQNRRFQIAPFWRALTESSVSVTDSLSVDGWPNRRDKLRFQTRPLALCGRSRNSS